MIALTCAHEGAAGIVICGRQADKGAAVAAAIEAIGSEVDGASCAQHDICCCARRSM